MARLSPFIAILLSGVCACGAFAQQDEPKKERVLTPEEQAEKESRKACKIEICATFRNKVEGPDIRCDIVKTWREEDIEDMVSGGKLSWPWGKARCEAKLHLSRRMLIDAVSSPHYEMSVPTHTVTCAIDRKGDGAPYKISVAMAPTVTFENGKAVSGQINWKDLEAPSLIYGAAWPATGLDNSTNVLGGQLVKLVNEFLTSKCDEVKDELPAAKPGQ